MMVQHLRLSLPVAAVAATFFFQTVTGGISANAQDRRMSSVASTPIVASDAVNGSISGSVFRDANGDRARSVGEVGFAFVTMLCHTLNSDGSIAATWTAMTNIDGNYTFPSLGVGRYRIECEG